MATRRSPQEVTAYHEAGHAVVAWRLGIHVKKATIVPGEDYDGRIEHARLNRRSAQDIELEDRFTPGRLQAEKRAMISLAGDMAQRRFAPRSRYGGGADFSNVVSMLSRYAVPDEGILDMRAHQKLLQVWTKSLLEANWELVKAVAEALLERQTLSSQELRAVIRSHIDAKVAGLSSGGVFGSK